jgi:hypothetical protein
MGFTSILKQKPQSSQQGKNGKGQNVFGLLLAALRGGAKHTISSALIKPSSVNNWITRRKRFGKCHQINFSGSRSFSVHETFET